MAKLLNGTDTDKVYSIVLEHKASRVAKSKFVVMGMLSGKVRSWESTTRLGAMNAAKAARNQQGAGTVEIYQLGKDGKYSYDETSTDEAFAVQQRVSDTASTRAIVSDLKNLESRVHAFYVARNFGSDARRELAMYFAQAYRHLTDAPALELHAYLDEAFDKIDSEEEE